VVESWLCKHQTNFKPQCYQRENEREKERERERERERDCPNVVRWTASCEAAYGKLSRFFSLVSIIGLPL
jgi:hypothetical protein